MSKSFRLSKLTPSQLKLMHDLAEVIRATGLRCTQDPIIVADLINQKIEEDDILPSESPDRADPSSTPSPTSERRRRRSG
jgi:hypothetical protein